MPIKATQDAMHNIVNYLMVEFIHRTDKDKLLTWEALTPDTIDEKTKAVTKQGTTANQHQKDIVDRADHFCKLIAWMCDPNKHKILIEKVEKDEKVDLALNNATPTSASYSTTTKSKVPLIQNANVQIIEHLETLNTALNELYKAQKNSKGRDFDFSRNLVMRTANVVSFGMLPGSINYISACWQLTNLYAPFIKPEFKQKAAEGKLDAKEVSELKECWDNLQITAKEIKADVFNFIAETKPRPGQKNDAQISSQDVGIIIPARLFSNFMHSSSYLHKKDDYANIRTCDLLDDMIQIQLRMANCDKGGLKDWTDRSSVMTTEFVEQYQAKSADTLPKTLKPSRTEAIRNAVTYITNKFSAKVGNSLVLIDQGITNLYLAECVNAIQDKPKLTAVNK